MNAFTLLGFNLSAFVHATLAEDLGEGLPGGGHDVTAESVIPADARFAGVMDSREAITRGRRHPNPARQYVADNAGRGSDVGGRARGDGGFGWSAARYDRRDRGERCGLRLGRAADAKRPGGRYRAGF